jgi:NADPH:quinone reductase-like Zn-dependent oxidoreductase
MKALICRRYGETPVLTDLPDPVPGPGEVLVKVRAATVSAADWRITSGQFPAGFGLLARLAIGWSGPRQPVPGTDAAGEVAALGPQVTGWAPGDRVVVALGARMGGQASLLRVPARALVRLPDGIAWPEAAALPFGGLTALHYLRKAGLKPGQTVLVIGASGAVGSALVQIARAQGAQVTGVTSTPNLDLVASLGAEAVDYRTTDWRRLGRRWDLILDATGTVGTGDARPCLRPGGKLGLIVGTLGQTLAASVQRDVIAGPAPDNPADLARLAGMAAAGSYRPVVSRTFPLEQAAAAYALVATGRKQGNIVLAMD